VDLPPPRRPDELLVAGLARVEIPADAAGAPPGEVGEGGAAVDLRVDQLLDV
jgi:hypothetical protein